MNEHLYEDLDEQGDPIDRMRQLAENASIRGTFEGLKNLDEIKNDSSYSIEASDIQDGLRHLLKYSKRRKFKN